MQEKPMRKYAGKLRADGLLHVHTQQVKNETNRVSSRDIFYINFHLAIDAIKYRLYRMNKHVESLSAPGSTERKELVCGRCGSDWTMMEVVDNLDLQGNFCCHRCQSVLKFRTNDEAETGGPAVAENATIQRLNQQLSPLLNLMQRLDSSTVPENDWETALANARPVQRAKEDQGIKNETVVDSQLRVIPQKVKGMETKERVEVSLLGATNLEEEERRRQEEREQKERLRAQNQLPSWHTHSTVTGLSSTGTNGTIKADPGTNGTNAGATPNGIKAEEGDEEKKPVKDTTNNTADLDGYFANLQKMMENEGDDDRHSPSNNSTSEDDDEDEFEDVTLPNQQTNAEAGPSTSKPLPNGVNAVKAENVNLSSAGVSSEDSSANPSGQNSDDEGQRSAKRVKIDEPSSSAAVAAGGTEQAGQGQDVVELVESDEDEDDFVDAM